MHTVTRRLSFDAGHRILGHQGKCRHIHGHRYQVDITCYATKLDDLGMVVDFGKIKEYVGDWIDNHLDHNLILHSQEDPLYELLTRPSKEYEKYTGGRLPYGMAENPTAENIARLLFSIATRYLTAEGITVQNVRVHETPNCWSDYPGPPLETK